MNQSASVDQLKDAIIAEIASDVLKIKDDVQELGPLVEILKKSLPEHFDLLRQGLIQTLEEIDEGIKEAGGERIEFVKGNLHVFIEQAIDKAFSGNSEKVEKLVQLFEKQNNAAAGNLKAQFDEVAAGMQKLQEAAAGNLKAQFDEVSAGMQKLHQLVEEARFPKWAKFYIPISLVVAIVCSSVVSWHFASAKEAVYMEAFLKMKANSKATK